MSCFFFKIYYFKSNFIPVLTASKLSYLPLFPGEAFLAAHSPIHGALGPDQSCPPILHSLLLFSGVLLNRVLLEEKAWLCWPPSVCPLGPRTHAGKVSLHLGAI